MTEAITREHNGPPLTEPGRPERFEGAIGIGWPPEPVTQGSALAGWKTALYDDDGPVTTVLSVTVHAAADSIIWAELTMFADDDGRPVLHGQPVIRDGQPLTGTFPFLVTSMRVS